MQELLFPLSTNPDWADVEPVQQDDGPEPVVQILYTDTFRDVMDYFRGILKRNELSERALQLTDKVIELNSANYTAWMYRRMCLDALQSNLNEELKWVGEVGRSSPKNYQLWQHRRWLVEKLNDPSEELLYTAEILQLDAKNYHSWAHRQWTIKTYGVWENELKFSETLIEADCRNNSAWNQRFFVLNYTTQFEPDIVSQNLDYTFEVIQKATDNQSPWNFVSGLLQKVEYSDEPTSKVVNFARSCEDCIPAFAMLVEIASKSPTYRNEINGSDVCMY